MVQTLGAIMRLGARQIDTDRPWLVGILNLTDDSFSADGLRSDVAAAIARGQDMIAAGADLLDLGAESTRPGAQPVDAETEIERLLPVIRGLSRLTAAPLSIDTRSARVAEACLRAGAVMINDVSGFSDPEMGAVVARHGAAWVLMHMPHATGDMGWSRRSEGMPSSLRGGCDRVVADLAATVDRAVAAGVLRSQLAVDPGIGFGKSLAQNLAFLRGPQGLDKLGVPLYLGPSRKSFIGRVTGAEVGQRLMGTAAAVTAAVLAGATFLRVHDVADMRQVVDVAFAIAQTDVENIPSIES